MRKFTTEHTVYKLDELSDEAKERAFDYFRQSEQFEWLSEDIEWKLEELLKESKISYDELPKIFYSLSYSQGDGAMFEGTVYWKSYTVNSKQSGHYYHYNSKNLDICSTKTDKDASEKIYEEFNEIYVDICKQLERYGYDVIENTNSEEMLTEMIESNDYEFYEDGRLA